MNLVSISLMCTFVVLLSCLGLSVYFNVKHGILILKVQDALENSLDILDERYRSISKIIETPLFFDSVEIRQVISDIDKCHESVLYVANILTDVAEERGEDGGS